MGQFGVGQRVTRVEDFRLVTGQGRYTADIDLDNQAWGHVVRSPHGHARIDGVDLSSARAMPGVLAIYTAEDLKRSGLGTIRCLMPARQPDGTTQPTPPHPILADGVVRHVGDPIAFIVAETPDQARDAAETVVVGAEPMPAVTDLVAATATAAPQIHAEAPGNISFRWEKGDRAATDAAFARAAHVVRTRLVNNRVVVNPIEPRAALGVWDGKRFTLYTPSQGPHSLRAQLADHIFDMPREAFHVVTPDVGGSFGMKIFLYAEQPLVLHAARELGRPVKWVAERTADGFLSDNHGRDQVNEVEMALDVNGRFLALRVHTYANMGAYLSNFGPYIPTDCGVLMINGTYQFEALHASVTGVFTNTVPTDAYRGAGRPEAIYLIERTVDAAARQLGIDGIELRRRNFIAAIDMPFKTAIGATYDSGDFASNLELALDQAGHDGLPRRKAAAAACGRLRGFGVAYYIENCGAGLKEASRIRIGTDGMVTLTIGTQSNGQGHETAYAQIIADKLGVDIDRICVIQGDTDIVARGRGTGGSRSISIGGISTAQAAQAVIDNGKRIAAEILEAAPVDIEFAHGNFAVAGTDSRASLAEVAAAAEDAVLTGEASYGSGDYTFPNGCHVCEVEIDPDTGAIEIVNYTAVDDFGVALNPMMLEGQVHGGIGQGIGQALHERCVYDGDGQLLSGSFMDYGLPRADEMPTFDLNFFADAPCKTNALGVKGAGEAGAIGAPPAVMNAIADALADHGAPPIDMPATPEALWRALKRAG